MTATQVRLVLVFPTALENTITEALIAAPASPAFTLLHAEGHGSDFDNASVAERIRGRIARRMLWLVLPASGVDPIITLLREQVPSSDVLWWEEPVLRSGRLA